MGKSGGRNAGDFFGDLHHAYSSFASPRNEIVMQVCALFDTVSLNLLAALKYFAENLKPKGIAHMFEGEASTVHFDTNHIKATAIISMLRNAEIASGDAADLSLFFFVNPGFHWPRSAFITSFYL